MRIGCSWLDGRDVCDIVGETIFRNYAGILVGINFSEYGCDKSEGISYDAYILDMPVVIEVTFGIRITEARKSRYFSRSHSVFFCIHDWTPSLFSVFFCSHECPTGLFLQLHFS